MYTLSEIVTTFFPGQTEKKHTNVLLRDRWVLFGKLGFFSSWYPKPVEFIETESYLLFDRRQVNKEKSFIYGAVIFVVTMLLTMLFFGYFSFSFVVFGFIVGVLSNVVLYLSGGTLTYGIIVVDKSWIESVFEKKGWIVVWGRKSYDECKSLMCFVRGEQKDLIGAHEHLLHATDVEQMYELFGVHERFELKYRGVK